MTHIQNHVFNKMNIPFTLQIAGSSLHAINHALQTIVPLIDEELTRIDQRYSPFRADSLVNQFRAGDQAILAEDEEFQHVYGTVMVAADATDHGFDPFFNGGFDPTGYIKGWAIEQITHDFLNPLLDADGISGVSFNGGGDIQMSSQDFVWRVGVQSPTQLSQLLMLYQIENGAVATSGFSKRGSHIKKLESTTIEQVSIIDSSLAFADVWATAGLSLSAEHFTKLIQHHHLTGNFVRSGQLVIFNQGVITDVQAA